MLLKRIVVSIRFEGVTTDFLVSVFYRAAVGLVLAYGLGFLGMFVGGFLIPRAAPGDLFPLILRIVLIALGTTVGIAAVWFTFLFDRWKSAALMAAAFAGSVGAGLIAFYWAEPYSSDAVLYSRILEITQTTLIGATIGANLIPLLVGFATPRHWRA
jgi:hypothetical protein